MKLIDPHVERIEWSDPFKKIEMIGRTCYKSENKITDDSAHKFVNGLIKRKHFAMLEHSELTFQITGVPDLGLYFLGIPFIRHSCIIDHPDQPDTHLVTVSLSHIFNPLWEENEYIKEFKDIFMQYADSGFDNTIKFEICTTMPYCGDNPINISLIPDLKTELPRLADIFKVEPRDIWESHGSYTFKFVCDRGVSHELVRHRCSFAQESTRYCNYSSDKFGREIQFIKPSTFDSWDENTQKEFINQLECSESSYLYLCDTGLSPQQARAILPTALKTEVIMTAPVYQWKHFFNLRSKGTTGAPHPDMKLIADMAYDILKSSEQPQYLI